MSLPICWTVTQYSFFSKVCTDIDGVQRIYDENVGPNFFPILLAPALFIHEFPSDQFG